MKKTILILLAMVTMTLSCTTNNGDIGPWFGLWHVEDVQCDGESINEYDGTIFFAFQSTVFQLRRSDHIKDGEYTTGKWEDLGDKIKVSFPDEHLVWVRFYGIDMSQQAVNTFEVEHLKGRHMTLTLSSSDGHTYRYILKKWG